MALEAVGSIPIVHPSKKREAYFMSLTFVFIRIPAFSVILSAAKDCGEGLRLRIAAKDCDKGLRLRIATKDYNKE